MPSRRPAKAPLPLPPWSLVTADDPRERPGVVEAGQYVSERWAKTVGSVSNKPWVNAARVIASIVDERPDARYVEGYAHMSYAPEWHAWVDVPLNSALSAWVRIDSSPMWRWYVGNNHYVPVLEVTAHDLAPLVAPLLQPRGRATCRLPLAPLMPPLPMRHQIFRLADSFATEFGEAAAARAAAGHALLDAHQAERMNAIYTNGRAELDRLAALGVLPKGE